MQTKLEFIFGEDDQEQMNIQLHASQYHSALWDILNTVLRQYKHADLGEEAEKVVETIKKDCWEVVDNLNISGDF